MALPEMQEVKSSNISHIGHDAPAEGEPTLYIRFSNGSTFRYPGVAREVFDKLAAAESVGKHFYANIRQQFTGVRVGETE